MSKRKFKTRSTRDAKWEDMPVVQGVVVEKGHFDDKGRQAPFIVIDTTVSLVRVYQSKDLDELFGLVKVGDSVRIEFLENVKLDKGRQFNRYDSSCWTGGDDEVA